MFLDGAKVVFACLIAWLIKHLTPEDSLFHKWIFVQLVGLSAFFGHIFPIYFKFKGGKGVACFFGFVIAFSLYYTLILGLLIIIIVKKTKKMSIASLVVPWVITLLSLVFAFHAVENCVYFNIPLLENVFSKPIWWVNTLFLAFMSSIIWITHIPNIKRLFKKEELVIQKEENKESK
jgi:glycerol-3-phosphate acyltransferase PlsY